jgi:hypothetical protein
MTCAHLDRKLLSLLVDLLNRHRAEDGPQVSLKRPKQTNKQKNKNKNKTINQKVNKHRILLQVMLMKQQTLQVVARGYESCMLDTKI